MFLKKSDFQWDTSLTFMKMIGLETGTKTRINIILRLQRILNKMRPNMSCSMPFTDKCEISQFVSEARTSYQIRKIAGCACAGMLQPLSPPPRVNDPDMHHGTCMTHVPWCMPGSLTSGFLWCRSRGNVPGIAGACATRNFTYLVRGPLKVTRCCGFIQQEFQ